MSVIPVRRWALGTLMSAIGTLGLVACDDPESQTDLRPEGPPDVLSVLVFNDPDGGLENATYCKVGDTKRPGTVGNPTFVPLEVCPDDLSMGASTVTNAVPTNPYVRVMFDELLSTEVEDLIEDPTTPDVFSGTLAMTQPFNFECDGVAVPYDGYYAPNGNAFTWPLGPSLVAAPLDPSLIATGATCTISLKPTVVVDKEGTPTPDTMGFTFQVAGLELLGSDPEPADDPAEAATITSDSSVELSFNGFVDAASLEVAEVVIRQVTDCTMTTGGTAVPAIVAANPDDPTSLLISTVAGGGFLPDVSYVIEFAAGADVEDVAGGSGALPDDFSLCFNTESP